MSGRPTDRCRGERGAAIFETALITPVFFLLVFGIFEFGLIFRDYLTVGDAVSDAARVASIRGPDRMLDGTGATPDYSIVKSIREATAAIPVEWIDSIVIFNGVEKGRTDPLTQAKTYCDLDGPTLAGSGCNFYPPRDSFMAVQDGDYDYFDCTAGGTNACGWDPLSRDDGPAFSDIDYVGVYVKVERPYITGIFGDDFTFEQATVVPLEPGTVT